ncbi:TonB-dependent receptor [Haliea sp. AH-315-K21]|uniref:Ligand-gated channel n=1 Tax=SAR86 cluster bacterium TaxID=2030880 RepID=A0A2A5CBG2_9GAMM|nr:TonB-dependent receptor [Haliea sp. AH-315-K21]PCJ41167.1 MAG: ligand-gated channel [SAR86 cluster bacterium]
MKRPALASLIALILTTSHTSTTLAQEASDNRETNSFFEEISIIGNRDDISSITGSAYLITPEQLQTFSYSDIQRIIREIPGVSIQIEDGYGLRPNISIRGVATERSSRITLLEDNVLIAPAPYAAPSAYYFPTSGRLNSVEVVKGPSAITQGPYTIGGALNMISTPIPNQFEGNILLESGEDSTHRLHANYGGYSESGFGFLLETHNWTSDGFQQINRSQNDTGFKVNDYTVKLGYAPLNSKSSIELKLQYVEQDSNQSYLGLTDNDFQLDSYQRYGISDLDNITTEHKQIILRYNYAYSDALGFTAVAYNNEHARNWFKTEGIDLDGSTDADSVSRTSWSNIINDINTNSSRDGFSSDDLHRILSGELDTAVGSIDVRSNNREYFSRGIQLGFNWNGNIGQISHSLEGSIRLHKDEEDRMQYDSSYQQISGSLVLNDIGALGAAGNRVQEANATAIYIYDRIQFGNWTFTPGIRFEDIELKRTRYRNGEARTFRDSRENDTQIWLPGAGISYQFDTGVTLLAGAHKGFTTPPNSPGVKPEEAINYEAGIRFSNSSINTELIAFHSDYENLLGVCTASSGTNCAIGDAFNGDAATVQGIEFILSSSVDLSRGIILPLMFSYTHINGEFDTNIASTDFFGDVSAGDPIPYIPKNQLQFSLGLESNKWGIQAKANYVDEVCVRASCGVFEKTDDTLTIDLTANYQINNTLNIYTRIENITSEEDIMGRHPYGARPNKGRTASVGARISF